MKPLLETFTHPADHLALDEVALLLADLGEMPESIRVWQFARPVVVMGRSTKVDYEVDRDYCREHDVPVLRRCSGGASVVGGPGCLMYSVVLDLDRHGELRKIDAAHSYVISRVLAAVRRQFTDVSLQGICDLTYRNRKFSGNSLRVARSHLLYHGTILYDSDLDLLASCLTNAPRQPQYRDGRQHDQFVTNVPVDPTLLTQDLYDVFDASETGITDLPLDEMRRVRELRYDNPKWHLRH